MKPICVPCERFMRAKKNGVRFLEGMPESNSVNQRGKGAEGWKPYKLWIGDLWECPDCKTQTISGMGAMPLAEHFHENFADLIEQTNADWLLIKDC